MLILVIVHLQAFQTLNYFVNIFNNQIGLQNFYWSLTDDIYNNFCRLDYGHYDKCSL